VSACKDLPEQDLQVLNALQYIYPACCSLLKLLVDAITTVLIFFVLPWPQGERKKSIYSSWGWGK
jgi:hypothetical protein